MDAIFLYDTQCTLGSGPSRLLRSQRQQVQPKHGIRRWGYRYGLFIHIQLFFCRPFCARHCTRIYLHSVLNLRCQFIVFWAAVIASSGSSKNEKKLAKRITRWYRPRRSPHMAKKRPYITFHVSQKEFGGSGYASERTRNTFPLYSHYYLLTFNLELSPSTSTRSWEN